MIQQEVDKFGERSTKINEMFESDNKGEIYELDIRTLEDFPEHPFSVLEETEDMQELIDSMKNTGYNILPAIVRDLGRGKYQLVSGHRRKRAAEILGYSTLRCVIIECSDEEATIMMVDSNIHRKEIKISEKAKAYQMKYDALKSKGKRTDLYSDGDKHNSAKIISEQTGESARQISRYIALSKLSEPILQLLNDKKLSFGTGVDIATNLNDEEQELLYSKLNDEKIPTKAIKEIINKKRNKQNFKLTEDNLNEIVKDSNKQTEEKLLEIIKIPYGDIKKYLPKDIELNSAAECVLQLLESCIPINKLEEYIPKTMELTPSDKSDYIYNLLIEKDDEIDNYSTAVSISELNLEEVIPLNFSIPIDYIEPKFLSEDFNSAWGNPKNYSKEQQNKLLEGFKCDIGYTEYPIKAELKEKLKWLNNIFYLCKKILRILVKRLDKLKDFENIFTADKFELYKKNLTDNQEYIEIVLKDLYDTLNNNSFPSLEHYLEKSNDIILLICIYDREISKLERRANG